MTEVKSEDLRLGDKVRVSYVDTITEIGGGILFGKTGAYTLGHKGVKFELLHREIVKPKAGETIRGNQLKDTPWKRGTLIRDRAHHLYALQANGDWRDLTFECEHPENREAALNAEFALFSDDEPIELLYVP